MNTDFRRLEAMMLGRDRSTLQLRLVTTAALLACMAPAVGCVAIPLNSSGNVLPREKTSVAARAATNATQTASPARAGRTLKGGSWSVRVASVRTSAKGPGGAKAGSGKTWLLIDTEFRNTRISGALFVNPKDATLLSASGKKLKTMGDADGFNGHGMREIGPGLGGMTVFAFRVPKGSSAYVFRFAPKESGKRLRLEWDVP